MTHAKFTKAWQCECSSNSEHAGKKAAKAPLMMSNSSTFYNSPALRSYSAIKYILPKHKVMDDKIAKLVAEVQTLR